MMYKAIPIALLAAGMILLIFGIDAYKAADSDVAHFFTGSPTDESMAIILGGLIASSVGAGRLLRGPRVGRNSRPR